MRYFMSIGIDPQIRGTTLVSGPQDEEQVAPEIRKLLAADGAKRVAVIFDHGQGERINVFEVIPEEPTHAQ